MCITNETKMSCGHRFTSIAKCNQASNCERRITETSYIDDTCARCDSGVHFHVLRAAYEHDHACLVRKYIQAKTDNDFSSAERLEREIAALHRATREKNATIATLRADPDVLWRSEEA